MILGIDIGGTTVKFGVVTTEGEIITKDAHDTHAWDDDSELFVHNLVAIINDYRNNYEIEGIGIGIPGLLSVDRRSTLSLANIPALDNLNLLDKLEKALPDLPIKIENDAKCAAIGETHFGTHADLNNYLLISLGTGVGGGLVLDKKLFIGVNGNATEIGHIPLASGKMLEDQVGQEKISALTAEWLSKPEYAGSSLQGSKITPKVIFDAAEAGDQMAKDIFFYVGECVGEILVGVARLLDLTNYVFAGGVAGAIDYITPGVQSKMAKSLPSYYTDQIDIRRASLKFETGLLGAAALIMDELSVVSHG